MKKNYYHQHKNEKNYFLLLIYNIIKHQYIIINPYKEKITHWPKFHGDHTYFEHWSPPSGRSFFSNPTTFLLFFLLKVSVLYVYLCVWNLKSWLSSIYLPTLFHLVVLQCISNLFCNDFLSRWYFYDCNANDKSSRIVTCVDIRCRTIRHHH